MARISAKQREENKTRFDNIIFNALMTGEWHKVSYQYIADQAGVNTRSTIQGYYPHDIDFIAAIQGKVLPVFMSYLNFESLDSFVTSWTESLEEAKFLNIVSMLTGNMNANAHALSIKGVSTLVEKIYALWGDEGYLAIELLLGRTLLHIAGIRKQSL
ncbi:hypothetical protein [Psychromonas sp. Urea-02u-13]|uniref:hypothetical protein n=1 Tax=Psychromonas sp. Urea-02u-13 TaxID=2058326 RepID=UPI000C33A6D1|nr:hypothetical protein [Psychromonas sp. Urea-02u-13]PKG38730.1 hypothetical protein CXF74_12345 [Psychromonas sp. Urea-02u-13]